MKSLVYYLLVVLVLWQAYQHITKIDPASIADSITPTEHVPDAAPAVSLQPQITKPTSAPKQPEPANFSCDGRTHCSQMRSLAEAQFFLKHCPNTKMDGDNDGRPCEQQFADWSTELKD